MNRIRRLAIVTLTIFMASAEPLNPQELNLVSDPSLTAVAAAGEMPDPAPLLERARLHIQNMPLASALSALRQSAGVYIAFSPSLLPETRVGCLCKLVSVGEALEHMLDGTAFRYGFVAGQIIVEPAPLPKWMIMRPAYEQVLVELAGNTHFITPAYGRTPILKLQGTITGRVVDATTQLPLAGAQVTIAGTGLGALTNAEGRYLIASAPEGDITVRVQLLGYAPAERVIRVVADSTTQANFALAVKAVVLNEIVATVSAEQVQRREIGMNIGRIEVSQNLSRMAITNFSDLLKARVPGLSVVETSGEVGTASRVRVRGATSLTQDNTPLVYIDGIRASNATGTGPGSVDFGSGQTISRIDDLNPYDIANVQVLKGPTAAALYGSEAASGVILIETKQGRAGETRYTLVMEQGLFQDVGEYPDNYYNLTSNLGITDINNPDIQQWRPVRNPATGDIFARHNPLENPLTNPFRLGHSQTYHLGISGGAGGITFYSSAKFEHNKGTLPNNNSNGFSIRTNVHARPTDKIDLSFHANYLNRNVRYNGSGRSALGILTNAGAGLPFFSFGTRADGSRGDCMATLFSGEPKELCEMREGNLTANFDKLATIQNEQRAKRFIGSIVAHVRPWTWFSNRLAVGIDYIHAQNLNLIPLDPTRPFGSESKGLRIDNRSTTQIITFDYAGTAVWNPTSDISSSTSFGGQYIRSENGMVGCTGRGFPSETSAACNAALTFVGRSDFSAIAEIGAFVQQRLGFRNYLFGTASVRADDNSAFGINQDAIWSPSVNFSAVLSDMPFWRWEDVKNLRVRAAWGTAAQAPAPFAARRTLEPVRVELNGDRQIGLSPLDPGNAELTAERNEEFELGLDASLFDDRIGLQLTYYNQKTTDAIVPINVAPSTGFPEQKFVNVGGVKNSGIEAFFHAKLLQRDNFRWDMEFGISTTDPIITDLGGRPPILLGAQVNGMFHVGYPPGAYYGPVITNATRDSAGNIVPGSVEFAAGNLSVPGFPQYRYLGDPTPSNREQLGTTITLWQNLRIHTVFERVGGFRKMDDTRGTRTPFIVGISGSRQFAFRQAESSPEIQAMMELNLADAGQVFIYDADYTKWRELTLTYRLPNGIVSAFGGVESATITLGARNLYTWTDYPGLSPEVSVGGGSDNFTTGSFFTQPPVRHFFFKFSTRF